MNQKYKETKMEGNGAWNLVICYIARKKQYPNSLLLFQNNCFYYSFGKDAKTIRKVLDLRPFKRKVTGGSIRQLTVITESMLDEQVAVLKKAGYDVRILYEWTIPDWLRYHE